MYLGLAFKAFSVLRLDLELVWSHYQSLTSSKFMNMIWLPRSNDLRICSMLISVSDR